MVVAEESGAGRGGSSRLVVGLVAAEERVHEVVIDEVIESAKKAIVLGLLVGLLEAWLLLLLLIGVLEGVGNLLGWTVVAECKSEGIQAKVHSNETQLILYYSRLPSKRYRPSYLPSSLPSSLQIRWIDVG